MGWGGERYLGGEMSIPTFDPELNLVVMGGGKEKGKKVHRKTPPHPTLNPPTPTLTPPPTLPPLQP